eukprot:gene27163-32815_t
MNRLTLISVSIILMSVLLKQFNLGGCSNELSSSFRMTGLGLTIFAQILHLLQLPPLPRQSQHGSIMPKVPSLQLSESSMAFNRPLSPQDLFSINDLSIQISNNVLEDYSMTGNWQAAEQVICLMNERNISPDELTYSLILSAYLNGNQVISAEEQATEMIRAGYMPERSMLCALIVMLGKSDMPHRAERLFHRIVSESKNASSVDLYDAIITAWSCSSSADKYSMIEDLYDRVMFLSLVPTPNIVLAYLYAHTQLTHTCSPDKAYSVYVEYGHLLDGFDGTKRMQGKVMQIVNMVISSLPKDQYSHSIQSKLMSILSSLESEESLHKSRKLFRWAIQHNVTSAGIYEAMVKKCIQLIPLNAPLCLDILMEEVLPSIHNCQVQISENLYILTIRRLSQALTSDQMMNRVIRGFILGQSNLISSVRIWDAIIDCAVSRYADMDGGFVDSILEIMRSHEVAFSTNTYEMVAGYFLNTQRYGELDRLIGVVMDASDGSNFGKDDNSADVDENAGDSAQMSLVLTYIHILSRIRRDSRKDNLANLLVSFKSLCTKYKERKANSLKSSTPIVYADCNEKINIAAALDQEGFAFIYHIYLLLLQYPCQDRHHMALHSYMMHTLSHIEDSLTLVTETPTYPYYVSGGSNSSYASGNSVMVLDLSMEILQNVQRLANKDHDNMSVEENFYVDFLKVLINSLPVKSEFIVSKAYDVYKHLNHTFSASNNSLSTSFYTKLFTLFAKSQRNHVPKLVDAIIADHSVSAVDGDVLQIPPSEEYANMFLYFYLVYNENTRVKKVGSLVDRYIFQHGNMLDARTFHLLVSLYEKNNPIEAFQLSSKLLPYILYPTKTSGKKVIEQVVTTMLNVFGHKYPLQCSRLALQCLESKIYLDSLVINEILSHLLHYAYSSSTAFMYPNTTSLAEYVYYSETLVNYCYKLGMKISAGSYHGIFQLIMSGQHDSTVEMAPALYKAFSKIEFTGSMMDKYILVHFYHSLLRLTDITDYTHKISQYAMQAYSQAIHGGVVPNLQVYHLLLQLLSRGRVSVVSYVDTLLKDMVDKFGISPDVVVYNMALQCYVKSNVPYADPRIDSILQSMQRRKLYPSLVTYSILLQSVSSGLSKSQPTLHHVELATKIFNNMLQAGITPDVKAWTILISIWCESNVADKEEQVLELVQKMETAGMHPNYITYTVMLSMWGMSKHPKASLYVREILLRMRKEHMQLDHMLFSSLLSALSKSRAPDAHIRSLEVLDSMVVHRVLPNAFHYSAVMNVFVHSNSTDKELVVMGLYDRMMKESCPPNSVIYSLMLHAWRNSTLPQAKDEVRKIYDIILDKRLSLDSRLMHNLLHALLKHFPHIEVYTTYIDRLIQHTLNYDLYVDKDVFKPLLRLFDLSIDVKKQLTLLVIKWMEQCKVQYDDVSVYQLCINNLCDINRFESEAIRRHNIENLDKLLAVLNEKQLTLDSYVYSKYCRMFAFIGNPRLLESIYGWLEHMVDRKVILEADTMRSMIKLHSINGTSSSVDLLNRLVLLYISSPKNGALGSDTMQFLMKMWTRQPNSAQVLEGTIALMEILSWKVLTRTLNMTAAPNGISDRNSLLMQIVSTMLEKQHHLMGIYSPSLETYDIYLSTLLTSLSFLRTNAELMRRVAYTFPAMMSELSVALKERKKYTKSSLEWKNGVDKNLGDVDQLLSRIEDSLKKFAIGVKVGFS